MKLTVAWQGPVAPDFGYNAGGVRIAGPLEGSGGQGPAFGDFFHEWRSEKLPEWRPLHIRGVDHIAAKHLLPWFGEMRLGEITRGDVLKFRAHLATLPGHRGKTLSASRINKVFVILGQVLAEGARRHGTANPLDGVRKLKALKPEVHPFTLEEVDLLCTAARPEWRDYLSCRFFTGMRTGEINGLRWHRVDFERNVIMVRETFSAGRAEDNAKSQHSLRDIPMLAPVRETLLRMRPARRGDDAYVFTSRFGKPVDAKNFTNRVFYPLLDAAGLARRRPYQTRHTTATLLLAAGENPEWIARFLGHATTEMLFTVYSRFVPNLTRHDGDAVASLLSRRLAPPVAGEPTRD